MKTTLKIQGMACSMCEAHICDAIRRAFPEASRVTASRRKGEAGFYLAEEADTEKLRRAIEEMGYTFVSAVSEPGEKHGLFRRRT